MPCILKTVGDLKKALEGLDDSLLLSMSVTGKDEESEDEVYVVPDGEGVALSLDVSPSSVQIFNANAEEMVYSDY